MLLSFNETLAEAIIDMDNIAYDEDLGPETEEKQKEWHKLVQFVAKEYNLQDLVCDKSILRE